MASSEIFRILVASDIHLGYAEKDAVRGEDSFNSFEEVLQVAREQKVDFLLLGGDLFHDNKPSAKSVVRCLQLLRKYCLGNEPVLFKMVSNEKENFAHCPLFPFANYEDMNINVGLPVFSIHGNHDDPTGKDAVGFVEALSASGLINYFGKYTDMDGIEMSPLLLQKGDCKLALYGLGSLPEERLHRFFLKRKIKFLCPEEKSDEWFKVFVVHQNRVKHGTKYLPEKYLSSLPDLVVWGHEHESRPDPEYNAEQAFHVYQPGSTVATSLSVGESVPKHVGLLECFFDGDANQFKVTPIPLKTVRQFFFDTINIDEAYAGSDIRPDAETVFEFCATRIEQLIKKAAMEHCGDERQPTLPLIRLRVDYSNPSHTFSTYKFGQHFATRVANPKELVLFKLKKVQKQGNFADVNFQKLEDMMEDEKSTHSNIEDIIKEYFEGVEEKSQLNLISENSVTLAVKEMVEKELGDAVTDVLEAQLKKTRDHLLKESTIVADDKSGMIDNIKKYKEDQKENEEKEVKAMFAKIRSNPGRRSASKVVSGSDSDGEVVYETDEEDDENDMSRGRGKGRSRGGRGGRGRGSRARGTAKESTPRTRGKR